ncbi:MAG: iron chelate uptake ABC transporter family permease subunit, partial [Saprospiraceae bacterium]|nr:iron chelate uptake ABC transporter family permease subunit [Saprospiraceae bacterium]
GISRLSKNENVHLDLKGFLFGTVLGVSDTDLYLTTVITVVVLAAIAIFFRQLLITTFQPIVAAVMGIRVKMTHYLLMLLLSFAVVASLRTVGVILVVAMLITPAATALLLSSRLRYVIILSALIGLLASVSGLVLSIIWEITPGPAMAVTVTSFYLLAVFFAPSKGLLFKYINQRAQQRKINVEDLLKQSFHLHTHKKLDLPNLQSKLGWSRQKILNYSRVLKKKGMAMISGGVPVLTEKGIESANQLIRAHRLWESYLVNDLGLSEEQIHDDAERYEHLLTEDLLKEVDAHLGFPATDPHGAPIPEDLGKLKRTLDQINNNSEVHVSPRQMNTFITNKLWQLGLIPGEKIKVLRINDTDMELESSGGDILKIPLTLARQIYIHAHHESELSG